MKDRPVPHDLDWTASAAALVNAKAPLAPELTVPSDGRDLPDVDLDQLAEDILCGLAGSVADKTQ